MVLFIIYSIVDRIWLQDDNKLATIGKTSTKSEVEVGVYVVSPQSYQEKISVGGTLLANEEVELSSEVAGKVILINFKEGSFVKQGDLLVKINDRDLQAQHSRAKYREKLAKDREKRQKVLLEKQAISQEEYDISLTELNSLVAETQLTQAQIEKTEIRAPFSGEIGLRRVSLGAFISQNQVVATLVDKHLLKLDFAVPEKYFEAMKTQKEVKFTVDGMVDVFSAKVYAMEPRVDPSTRTVHLRAMVPNADFRLVPGAFAKIELNLELDKKAVVIPAVALIAEAQGKKVFVIKNGLAQEQVVETAGRNETAVQIVQGLKVGDTVVVNGIMQIRSGMPLKGVAL